MTKNKFWFVTYSSEGYGEANGFYCPECFQEHIEPLLTPAEGISLIDPLRGLKYECDICRKDYRS